MTLKKLCSRGTGSALLLFGLVALGDAQNPASAAPDEVVTLPPVFVEPATRPIRWTYARAGKLELITTHDRAFARSFVHQYFRQLQLVREIVPDRYLWEPYLPTRHIIVGLKNKRRETDQAMSAILDQLQQKQGASTDRANDKQRFLPNLRLSGHDSSVVFAFQDEAEETPSSAFGATAYFDRNYNPRWRSHAAEAGFYFTTNRLTQLLSLRSPALPAWLIVGLTGVYDSCRFDNDSFTLTNATWRSPAEADALRLDPDRPRDLMVLRAFFEAPPPLDPDTRQRWQEQATLFVRWALFADDGAYRTALWNFVDDLELAEPTDPVFRQHFGFGFSDARDRLSAYLSAAVVESFAVAPTEFDDAPPAEIKRALPGVAYLIQGEWERLETNYVRQHAPALVDNYLGRARATVARARDADDSLEVRALSGLLEYEADNIATARADLEAAVAGGIQRPRVLQVLAQLRYLELVAATPADQPIDAAKIGAVTFPLEMARDSSPALPEIYAQMATLWLKSDVDLTRRHIADLATGARLFPQHPAVIGRMALLQANRGNVRSALQIVDYARTRCRDAQSAATYDELRAQLANFLPPP
ncbi:hypothetical protein [Synoicihabitans lomoniglobus]|uniref:Uncharacterized protein n=1 Tax=Synoicihabitans lomoniglobus TaxID=2909285 RepID=A0AAF0CPR3_9BACT|nr:hypothetical protein [Opitutaceae bacterium LMO-M01]WED65801.1 hypothetical protein PXH66_02935 [Opitutaceae bacterium LMO-M01]